MDSFGNNRYGLLFMDDDGSDPLNMLKNKKSKQQQNKKNLSIAASTSTTATSNNIINSHQTNQNHLTTNKTINNKKSNQNLSTGHNQSNNNNNNHHHGTAATATGKENKLLTGLNNKNDKKLMNLNSTNNSSNLTTNKTNNLATGHGQGQQNKKNVNNSTNTTSVTGSGAVGGTIPPVISNNKDQQNNNNRNTNKQQERQYRDGKASEKTVNFKTNNETREQRNNRRNRDDIRSQNGQQQQNGTFGTSSDYQATINDRSQRRGAPFRRNFDNNPRAGKREFDRQSGSDKTGVKAVDKRDGSGAHNWGSLKQDIEDLNKTVEDVSLDKDDSGNEQSAEQSANVEEETKELTLDEWKAQRALRPKPQYNIRKAGEGEDPTQWKKMIALNNKKRDHDSDEEMEYDPAMYPQRVGRVKRVLDIEINFKDSRRSGGPGRGRGRIRGQAGTGIGNGTGAGAGVGGGGSGIGRQGRIPRNNDRFRTENGSERQRNVLAVAPKVDDKHDFPSLGENVTRNN